MAIAAISLLSIEPSQHVSPDIDKHMSIEEFDKRLNTSIP